MNGSCGSFETETANVSKSRLEMKVECNRTVAPNPFYSCTPKKFYSDLAPITNYTSLKAVGEK